MAKKWNPSLYASTARFVADHGLPVVDWLAPQPGERVLDLGCGDGALTQKLIALGCQVIAVDQSAAMVEAARQRGIDAHVVDARRLTFDGEFDAVFSNVKNRNSDGVTIGDEDVTAFLMRWDCHF